MLGNESAQSKNYGDSQTWSMVPSGCRFNGKLGVMHVVTNQWGLARPSSIPMKGAIALGKKNINVRMMMK